MLSLDDLIGKQYKGASLGPEEFDCYSLVAEVRKRAGISTPHYVTPTSIRSQGDLIAGEIAQHIVLEKPQPFCVVAIRMVSGIVNHIGCVLENCTTFIHILKHECVVIERLYSPLWKNRIAGYYEFTVNPSSKSVLQSV